MSNECQYRKPHNYLSCKSGYLNARHYHSVQFNRKIRSVRWDRLLTSGYFSSFVILTGLCNLSICIILVMPHSFIKHITSSDEGYVSFFCSESQNLRPVCNKGGNTYLSKCKYFTKKSLNENFIRATELLMSNLNPLLWEGEWCIFCVTPESHGEPLTFLTYGVPPYFCSLKLVYMSYVLTIWKHCNMSL